MNLRATPTRIDETPRAALLKFAFSTGDRPLDGYTIKRGIGQGGFGEVYFAVSDAGKEVALKLIRRHLEVELRGVTQCLNLKHPNLLGLYDIRTDAQDDCWVVMEYVSGESLQDVLERNPSGMPLDEVLYWTRGIAAGVAYLHDHGIVHRDLKPGNIFSDEGIVKIGDYGLAKFISCSRRSQTEGIGTVHYMAPEIANGRYGKEIDIYSVGILLYEMLTGQVPFDGESAAEVLMKHLTAPPDLSSLKPPFHGVVARALTKDPEKRLAGMKEMMALLPASPADTGAMYAGPVEAGSGAAAAAMPSSTYRQPIEIVQAELVESGEPVARLVSETYQRLSEQWADSEWHPAAKLAVLVCAALGLISTAAWWLPLLFALLIVYGVYWCIRAVVLSFTRPRPVERASRLLDPAAPPGPDKPLRRKQSWRAEAPPPPPARPKSAQQKLTELVGSMLIATLIAAVITLVMTLPRGQEIDRAVEKQFLWLAVVSVLGSWAVMVPAKCWEGKHIDQAPLRFVMLVAGLLLGAGAFALAQFLLVDLAYDTALSVKWSARPHLPRGVYGPDGSPLLPTYMAYFGFLLLAVRWWRLADPGRAARLSLWAVVGCLAAAWLIHVFWPFPQPWGLMSAAIIAISVQLSSPWQPRPERQPGTTG